MEARHFLEVPGFLFRFVTRYRISSITYCHSVCNVVTLEMVLYYIYGVKSFMIQKNINYNISCNKYSYALLKIPIAYF